MDSYVVRIYRRNSSSPQNLVGLVELVEVNQERAFTSLEELSAILNCKQARIPCSEDGGEPETAEDEIAKRANGTIQ